MKHIVKSVEAHISLRCFIAIVLVSALLKNMPLEGPGKSGETEIKW
jgi:hypothetical protein